MAQSQTRLVEHDEGSPSRCLDQFHKVLSVENNLVHAEGRVEGFSNLHAKIGLAGPGFAHDDTG